MKPIVLAILDGWGYSTNRTGNPILEASTPFLKDIEANYPMLLLQASGLAVGLQWGDFGNSEVGHLTIGAGRPVQQYSLRIERAIKDGSFFENEVVQRAFSHPRLHLVGLLTAGNVHADISHILALLEVAQRRKVPVVLHLFTDGKDSGLHEGSSLVRRIPLSPSTMIGRSFGMDRDNNWDLTQQAFELIVHAKGEKTDDFSATLEKYYATGLPDTDIPPLVSSSYAGAQKDDGFFFFNFREDSMGQLYSLFLKTEFSLYSMTQYVDESAASSVFSPLILKNGISEMVSLNKLRQLHVAETLKYAHATYFFNGFRNEPFDGEDDILVQSEKDVEQHPAMGAENIARRAINGISKYDFIVLNFANADILAHTGNFEATRDGVEAIDASIGALASAVLDVGGILLVTADHGNAEKLIDRFTSEPESRHDGSPVPIYFVGRQFAGNPTKPTDEHDVSGILADIAPTILELMGISKPPEMTGVSLLPKLLDHGR